MGFLILQVILWYGFDIQILGKLSPLEFLATPVKGVIGAAAIFWALVFISTLIFGPLFCGWLCVVGTYSDLLDEYIFGKFKSRKRIKIGAWAGYIKYLLLALIVFRTLVPLKAGLPKGFVFDLNTPAPLYQLPVPKILLFLIITAVLIYFLGSRAWCRYICPTGAALKIMGRLAPFKIRLVGDCTDCALCNRVCPANIAVADEVNNAGGVNDENCVVCLECIEKCRRNVLKYGMESEGHTIGSTDGP